MKIHRLVIKIILSKPEWLCFIFLSFWLERLWPLLEYVGKYFCIGSDGSTPRKLLLLSIAIACTVSRQEKNDCSSRIGSGYFMLVSFEPL